MAEIPGNVARVLSDWGGRRQYRQHGLLGECLGLLADIRLGELPWDSAPKAQNAAGDGVARIKTSDTRSVLTFTIQGPGGAPVRVYAKRNLARNPFRVLVSLFHRSKSRREWKIAWKALGAGVPVSTPLAWAERRRGGMATESYLVTLGIARSVSFRTLWKSLSTPEARCLWVGQLGRFVRSAHDRGFAHDDLSVEHVLVATGSAPSGFAPTFHFIDLDQSRLVRRLSPYRRAHNFFQVFRSLPSETFTAQERLAFYEGYSHGTWTEEHIEAFQRAIQWIGRLKRLSNILKVRKRFRRGRSERLRMANDAKGR
jgi:tRNA A-37 threonylcarbamoyl transferase component Bud32